MKKLAYSLAGVMLAAGTAQAQPADQPADAPAHDAGHAAPDGAGEAPVPAAPAPETAASAASPAGPAEPAAPALAVADVSEAEIDSFAKATVKLQAIQADATIATEQKQAAMQAAVTEAGLDPAKYNAIGKATQADPALRAKVQTAMSRHTAPPGEG